jgi:hypothetical protein
MFMTHSGKRKPRNEPVTCFRVLTDKNAGK